MAVKVYEYAKCSTCRNALKWLDAHKVPYQVLPIVERPPSLAELKSLWEKSGLPLAKFFNTSGLVYRELDLGAKLPTMSDSEKLKLLASDGKLIKRPLLVDGDRVFVGFKPETYKEHFQK